MKEIMAPAQDQPPNVIEPSSAPQEKGAQGIDLNMPSDLLIAALDYINQGFSVMDGDLNVIMWNRRFIELLDFPEELVYYGVSLESLLYMNAKRGEYGAGLTEELVRERIERALTFEPHYFERTRPNGQVIAVRGMPLPQGGFVTTYTDVTRERRRQQDLEMSVAESAAALRHNESRLQFITDAIPALIAHINLDLRYTFANKRYAKWFGYSTRTIIDQDLRDVLGPVLYKDALPYIERALNGEEAAYEYSRQNKLGQITHMRSTLMPDYNSKGEVEGCFVLSLDISDQKRNENLLMQSQRMEAIGQLTGGISHDFNNLLTIILGNLVALQQNLTKLTDLPEPSTDEDALLDEIQPPATARQENHVTRDNLTQANGTSFNFDKYIAPALHAARQGSDLTSRLLSFSRGQALDPRPVNINKLTTGATKLLRGSLPKTIEIVTNLPDPPVCALVDTTELENGLVNLALNARDAMPEGGRLEFNVSEITLNKSDVARFDVKPGRYACIVVRDSGRGMDEHVRMLAFEPFFTTKPFGKGSGLGLSMVYGFTRQSGGAAIIQSVEGRGTAITLLLPAAEMEEPSREIIRRWSDDTHFERISKGELVLLVEDDPDVSAVVRGQLQDLGFTVIVAEGADDAMALVRSISEIEYLLSDIVMPGQTNGIVLANQAKYEIPDLKVALISGFMHGLGSQELGECPFPILSKPFNRLALADLLQRAK